MELRRILLAQTRHCMLSAMALSIASSVMAEGTLPPLSLFHRCYGQITGLLPQQSDPLLLQVQDGTVSPTDACLQVLRQARLTSDNETRIADPTNAVAKAVIHTFHKLHGSWFGQKTLQVGTNTANIRGVAGLYDGSAPALFYTQALLKPGGRVRNVLVGNQNLRAIRTDQDPATSSAGVDKANNIFGSAVRFAPIGEILGVEPTGDLVTAYSYNPRGVQDVTTGSEAIGATRGAGVLGTPAYLLLNVGQEAEDFRADGAVEMPRMWAKAIFSDFLCREIPVIRLDDARDFVVAASPVEFRKSAGCVQCHATQDRLAATIRNFTYKEHSPQGQTTPLIGGVFVDKWPTNQPAEPGWPSDSDPNYYLRPTNGVLYYRDYEGDLVNVNVAGIAAVGRELVDNHNDFYICAAQRYYRYFTGVEVNIGDIADRANPISLSARDTAHRNAVIALGIDLKSHQSLIQLISDIIKLPTYAEPDFGQ